MAPKVDLRGAIGRGNGHPPSKPNSLTWEGPGSAVVRGPGARAGLGELESCLCHVPIW